MRVAALLGLLAALPAHAGDAVSPAQARTSVVQALPPEIAKGAGNQDLRTYLERLTPEQKQAALRSLTAKEGELGDDPTTLGVIGQAYAGLGKVKEARHAAEAALRQNPNDAGARQLLGWVTSQEKLAERGSSGGSFAGDTRGPGGGGQAAGGRQASLNALEQRIQGLFRRGQNSDEFKSTMQDARGLSVAELNAAGIAFQRASADQKDAVLVSQHDGKFTISIRDDALASPAPKADVEARAAAQVANGVRQAQTLRDHEYLGWAIIKARGWISGARTHKELAPNDIDAAPATPSDQNLMAQRKLLSVKEGPLPAEPSTYGDGDTNRIMQMLSIMGKTKGLEPLFQYFMTSTKRDGGS